jgi:hypothetical protein
MPLCTTVVVVERVAAGRRFLHKCGEARRAGKGSLRSIHDPPAAQPFDLLLRAAGGADSRSWTHTEPRSFPSRTSGAALSPCRDLTRRPHTRRRLTRHETVTVKRSGQREVDAHVDDQHVLWSTDQGGTTCLESMPLKLAGRHAASGIPPGTCPRPPCRSWSPSSSVSVGFSVGIDLSTVPGTFCDQ